MDTKKLLIITWILLAFLIGGGVGYLLGVQGFGQRLDRSGFGPSQDLRPQNFGPGPQQGQNPQLNQGDAPAGAPGGRNPVPNQNGSGSVPNGGGQ